MAGLGGITRFAPPDAGGQLRRQAPVVRRRDRPRAKGDAWWAEGTCVHDLRGVRRLYAHRATRSQPRVPAPAARGTSASGHFTGMPARSPHARGACALDDRSGWQGWVANHLAQPHAGSRFGARRPRSAAATAACGWGCAPGGRRCVRDGASARGHFTTMPTRSHVPARLTAVPAPAARRPPARGWDARGAEGVGDSRVTAPPGVLQPRAPKHRRIAAPATAGSDAGEG